MNFRLLWNCICSGEMRLVLIFHFFRKLSYLTVKILAAICLYIMLSLLFLTRGYTGITLSVHLSVCLSKCLFSSTASKRINYTQLQYMTWRFQTLSRETINTVGCGMGGGDFFAIWFTVLYHFSLLVIVWVNLYILKNAHFVNSCI